MGDVVTGEDRKQSDDFLGMSDDDFLNLNSPGDGAAGTEEEKEAQPAETGAEAAAEGGTPEASKAGGEGEEAAQDSDDDAGAAGSSPEQASADQKPSPDTEADKSEPAKATEADAEAKTDPDKTDPAKAEGEPDATKEASKDDSKDEAKPVDLQAFYNKIMTPFKANGRIIELKDPEEAIRLMQMGAGYGRKIQDLQPHLKTLRMLEKNDLLDPERLSFLIDINAKNPEAIKKLIKDAGIDPLDLNNEDNVGYKPTNHAVSDKEMAFQETLTDIQSHATGQETLRIVNQTWDQESKSALWDQPEILRVIQSQRENGIYDQIVTEIERQRVLGYIPHATPFLQAYKIAGDHLQSTNGFRFPDSQEDPIQPQQEQAPASTPQPQVIATRPAAPKAQVQNGDKAAAASPTKSSNSRGKGPLVNPLEMADEEFIKQFSGRL